MTLCPFADWKPVQNHSGAMSAHYGLVLHVQQGNGGLQGWFSNPSSNASSTFWVSKTGTLEQYVDANDRAWAQGDGNYTFNSVETEGYVEEPLTDAQERILAKLYAWGNETYRWPNSLAEHPAEHGFGWHGMGGSAWGGHVDCPGDLRKNRRRAILDIAFGTPAPVTSPSSSEDSTVCIVTAPGRLDLFVVGTDHGVYQATGTDQTTLSKSEWIRIGGPQVYAKAVSAAWTSDYKLLYVTVHGNDDHPYTCRWDTVAGAWTNFDGNNNGLICPNPYEPIT